MHIALVGNFIVNYTTENYYKQALEALGHSVKVFQEGTDITGVYDILVWSHTSHKDTQKTVEYIKRTGVKTVAYHLDLFHNIARPDDYSLTGGYIQNIDYFFSVDPLLVEWINKNTKNKAYYLPAGVGHKECYNLNVQKKRYDIVFTGTYNYHTEWPYRRKLINHLRSSYRFNFYHFGNDGIKLIREKELNEVLQSSKVVIGDTLCLNFSHDYYYSDRLFETTGRGGFLIFPYIKGIEDNFKLGEEIITYKFGDFYDLNKKINYFLRNEKEREKIREAGRQRTIRDHTYLSRWHYIFETLKNETRDNNTR